MSDIAIDWKILTSIQNRVRRRFMELNPEISKVKWNSNPVNYQELQKSILDNTDCKGIGLKFLRNFFFDSTNKKAKNSFRLSNINSLTQYIQGIDYFEYLSKDSKRQAYFYYDIKDRKKVEELIKDKEDDPILIDIESKGLENIFDQARNEEQEVHFYISKNFINNEKGSIYLIELFYHNLFRYLFDLDIFFSFDDEILSSTGEESCNIVSPKGIKNFIKCWKERQTDILELNKELGIVNTDEKSVLSFFIALKTLAEIKALDWKQRSGISSQKIDNFLPAINRILFNFDVRPEPLNRIWEISLLEKIKPCTFLCVIGYEGYFKLKEKFEMLRYFKKFNEKLIEEGHRIIRIFTLPAKRVKSKGWSSNMPFDSNLLLYQYLLTNVLSNAETYLFIYNEDIVEPSNKHILLFHDYVIRLKNNDEWGGRSIAKEIYDEQIIVEDIYKNKTDAELYLAYPEDLNGVNQILRIRDVNNTVRYFEDFKHRINHIFNPSDDDIKVIDLQNEQMINEECISCLNLNHLDVKELENLRENILI